MNDLMNLDLTPDYACVEQKQNAFFRFPILKSI